MLRSVSVAAALVAAPSVAAALDEASVEDGIFEAEIEARVEDGQIVMDLYLTNRAAETYDVRHTMNGAPDVWPMLALRREDGSDSPIELLDPDEVRLRAMMVRSMNIETLALVPGTRTHYATYYASLPEWAGSGTCEQCTINGQASIVSHGVESDTQETYETPISAPAFEIC